MILADEKAGNESCRPLLDRTNIQKVLEEELSAGSSRQLMFFDQPQAQQSSNFMMGTMSSFDPQ